MLALLCFLIPIIGASYLPTLVNNITIEHPAFTLFIQNPSDTTKYHLAVSTFNAVPFTKDEVFYYSNFDMKSSNVQKLNNKNLVWPNELSIVNESILSEKIDPYGGLFVPYGFLVPTKSKGGIGYYPFFNQDRTILSPNEPIQIASESKIDWFYHRVRHVDITGDGIKDLLTCRTVKPIIGKTETQLVGYTYNSNTLTWTEHVIANEACDVFFDVADIDKDGRTEIVAAGYFIAKLNLIYSNDPRNNFLNSANLFTSSIDTQAGKLFDVLIDDIDKKGNLELLVTNHQGEKDAIKGALYYYQLNGPVRNGTWSRKIIYNDFPVLKSGVNQAAPGAARLFYPKISESQGPAHIILAGDGSEYAYVFEPYITNGSLSYRMIWSQWFKGDTVGLISCEDLNNDGFNECVIPLYEANVIKLYTFKP